MVYILLTGVELSVFMVNIMMDRLETTGKELNLGENTKYYCQDMKEKEIKEDL